MSAANKAKGTNFETAIVDYLNSRGQRARRLARTGVKDTGDVEWPTRAGVIVVEAKARRAMELATWVGEAEAEACHYSEKYVAEAFPLVVSKRRGKGTAQAYAVMALDDFVALVDALQGGRG